MSYQPGCNCLLRKSTTNLPRTVLWCLDTLDGNNVLVGRGKELLHHKSDFEARWWFDSFILTSCGLSQFYWPAWVSPTVRGAAQGSLKCPEQKLLHTVSDPPVTCGWAEWMSKLKEMSLWCLHSLELALLEETPVNSVHWCNYELTQSMRHSITTALQVKY